MPVSRSTDPQPPSTTAETATAAARHIPNPSWVRDRNRQAASAAVVRLELAGRRGLQAPQGVSLDLADALPGEVHERSDGRERLASPIGHVERAALRDLPHLEVRKVELDGAGLAVDVQVE